MLDGVALNAWNTHYEWLYDLYMHGKVREAVLDNVKKLFYVTPFI